MNKCKCGHTELAHGEDGKSCLAMLCLCEQFQPCEVEPEPKPIDTGHPYDQSDLDDTEPEPTHRIKMANRIEWEERATRATSGDMVWDMLKDWGKDEASANSQLQTIVKELEQDNEAQEIAYKFVLEQNNDLQKYDIRQYIPEGNYCGVCRLQQLLNGSKDNCSIWGWLEHDEFGNYKHLSCPKPYLGEGK